MFVCFVCMCNAIAVRYKSLEDYTIINKSRKKLKVS